MAERQRDGKGASSFQPNLELNAGRFNTLELRGLTMIIDYGHNTSALRKLIGVHRAKFLVTGAAPISPDLVGLEFPVSTETWSSKDVMLYALGVGARPVADLDFIYEGRGPRVLPTYAVIPGGTALRWMMRMVEMRLEMLLHGEQSIELFRPLPPEARLLLERGRVGFLLQLGRQAEAAAAFAAIFVFNTPFPAIVIAAGLSVVWQEGRRAHGSRQK